MDWQRCKKRGKNGRGRLAVDREKLLNDIGFVWNPGQGYPRSHGNNPSTKNIHRSSLSRKRTNEASTSPQTCFPTANKKRQKKQQARTTTTDEKDVASYVAPSHSVVVVRAAESGSDDAHGGNGRVEEVASWIKVKFTNKEMTLPLESTITTYFTKLVKFGLISANHLDDMMKEREYFDKIFSEEVGMTGWDRRVLIGSSTTTASATNGAAGPNNKGVFGGVASWIRTMVMGSKA